jgi:hypothetical protein
VSSDAGLWFACAMGMAVTFMAGGKYQNQT